MNNVKTGCSIGAQDKLYPHLADENYDAALKYIRDIFQVISSSRDQYALKRGSTNATLREAIFGDPWTIPEEQCFLPSYRRATYSNCFSRLLKSCMDFFDGELGQEINRQGFLVISGDEKESIVHVASDNFLAHVKNTTSNGEMLAHEFFAAREVDAICAAEWRSCKHLFWLDFAFEFCTLIDVSVLSHRYRSHYGDCFDVESPDSAQNHACDDVFATGHMIRISLLVCKFAIDELFQFMFEYRIENRNDSCCCCCNPRLVLHFLRSCWTYCTENIADVFTCAIEVIGLISMKTDPASVVSQMLFAMWVGVRWLRISGMLKNHFLFGPNILPITTSIRDTGPFMMVTVFAYLALSHTMYVLASRDDPPSPIYSALMMTFRLGILGDVDRFELEGTDPSLVGSIDMTKSSIRLEPSDPPPTVRFTSVWFWAVATAIVMQLLLLQVLVGILSQSYAYYSSNAHKLFVKERFATVLRLRSRWYYNLKCLSCNPKTEDSMVVFAVPESEVVIVQETPDGGLRVKSTSDNESNTDELEEGGDEKWSKPTMMLRREEHRLVQHPQFQIERLSKIEKRINLNEERHKTCWAQIMAQLDRVEKALTPPPPPAPSLDAAVGADNAQFSLFRDQTKQRLSMIEDGINRIEEQHKTCWAQIVAQLDRVEKTLTPPPPPGPPPDVPVGADNAQCSSLNQAKRALTPPPPPGAPPEAESAQCSSLNQAETALTPPPPPGPPPEALFGADNAQCRSFDQDVLPGTMQDDFCGLVPQR